MRTVDDELRGREYRRDQAGLDTDGDPDRRRFVGPGRAEHRRQTDAESQRD